MISDKYYTLTMEDMKTDFITDKINGYLEAIILEVSSPIRFDVYLDDTNDICILKETNFNGKKFILLRMLANKNTEEVFNYSHEKIPLNNRLKFYFRGTKNTKIKLILRYS